MNNWMTNERDEIALKDNAIRARDEPLWCHVCESHKDREEFDDCVICFECLDSPPEGE